VLPKVRPAFGLVPMRAHFSRVQLYTSVAYHDLRCANFME
jgi:hypothetical protein